MTCLARADVPPEVPPIFFRFDGAAGDKSWTAPVTMRYAPSSARSPAPYTISLTGMVKGITLVHTSQTKAWCVYEFAACEKRGTLSMNVS